MLKCFSILHRRFSIASNLDINPLPSIISFNDRIIYDAYPETVSIIIAHELTGAPVSKQWPHMLIKLTHDLIIVLITEESFAILLSLIDVSNMARKGNNKAPKTS